MEDTPTRREVVAGAAATLGGFLAGCTGTGGTSGSTSTSSTDEPTATAVAGTAATPSETANTMDWRTASLTEVLTDETFSIASLPSPVVLETFAVWCPVCTGQQEELATLDADRFSRVSLNVDPNESAETVRQHATEHGFDWRYAVSPAPVTRSLVAEFTAAITVAPSAPVVVVCEDGSATYRSKSGIKSAETIRSTAGDC